MCVWNKAWLDVVDGAEEDRRERERGVVGGERTAGDDYMLQFRPAVREMQPLRGKRISSLIKEVRMEPRGRKYNLFWKKKERERERGPGDAHTQYKGVTSLP